MEHLVYLSIGTNVGQRAANLRAALKSLPPQVQVVRASPVYETAPWGYADQPAFLNQVVEAHTDLPPGELLVYLKSIETKLGRQPTFRYGPRLIDLDILFYDDLVYDSGGLKIPHPALQERAFVLTPLADLAGDLAHPVLKQTVRQMLGAVDQSGVQLVMSKLPPFGARTFLMGIINVTPDSFSGDGILQWSSPLESAVEQARRFLQAGADILDVGGESTRPGAEIVDEQEELNRVVPVIEAIKEEFNCLVSVDTYKSAVARAALEVGADWLNDVWGLRADPQMAQLAAGSRSPIILMHNRLKPNNPDLIARLGGHSLEPNYTDLLADVKRELLESVDLARSAGVSEEHIILDPGIGFGKTLEQNLELVDRLDEIASLGYPVLLGPSRKSFIGRTLNLPENERVEGTAAAVTVGIVRGADIVRVHDVEAMARVVAMTDAILRHARLARRAEARSGG